MGADGTVRGSKTAMRVVIVTMDTHLATATQNAAAELARECPGRRLSLHAASEWSASPAKLDQCRADIDAADIVGVTMVFMEDHF